MSNNNQQLGQIKVATCTFCGHNFPCISAEFTGPDGKKQVADIPVVPVPLPAYRKAPSLISLTGQAPAQDAGPPKLTDRLDGVYVFLPHELVCDKRHRAQGQKSAPAHTFLIVPKKDGPQAVPAPPAEGENN